jgi:lysophospholipase L1-like esterase
MNPTPPDAATPSGTAGRSRDGLRAAMLVLGALALCVALAEAGVRAWMKWEAARPAPAAAQYQSYPYRDRAQSFQQNDVMARMDYNTYLGYLPRSGSSGRGYRTNASHMRYGEELARPKPAAELRVFVVGGSTAWGAGVSQDQLYSTLMERRFDTALGKNPAVRVIAAGVAGYVSTQERLLVESVVLDLEPDVVVMLTGANDIYNGYRGNNFLRNQDFFRIRRAVKQSGQPPFDVGDDPDVLAALDPVRSKEYRLMVGYLADRAWFAVRTRWQREEITRRIRGLSLPGEQTLRHTLRNVHALRDWSRRYGFQLVVCLQPHLAATAKVLGDWEQTVLERSRAEDALWLEYAARTFHLFRERLPPDAAREGYAFRDAERAVHGERESLFVDQFHLGDRGNAALADYLYGELDPIVRALARERGLGQVAPAKGAH